MFNSYKEHWAGRAMKQQSVWQYVAIWDALNFLTYFV
jgi:hypothetical protein